MDTAVELGQLCDTVNQLGDFRAKLSGQFVQRHATVFYNVVEQGGRDCLLVKAKVSEEQSDFQGVGNIRLAGLSHLPFVAAVSEMVGVFDQLRSISREILPRLGQESVHSLRSHYPKVNTSEYRIRPEIRPRIPALSIVRSRRINWLLIAPVAGDLILGIN